MMRDAAKPTLTAPYNPVATAPANPPATTAPTTNTTTVTRVADHDRQAASHPTTPPVIIIPAILLANRACLAPSPHLITINSMILSGVTPAIASAIPSARVACPVTRPTAIMPAEATI